MEEDQIFSIHADACKMFSHQARLKIIYHLREGEKSVTELAEATGLNQPNVSQHLAKMREKNFVKTRKEGPKIYYSIANEKIFEAFDLMREIIKEQMTDPEEL
ncbi:MAG: ArsR/SmtB family transcription factor [Thermoplasmata archaeon]